jgi:hypothetical protein
MFWKSASAPASAYVLLRVVFYDSCSDGNFVKASAAKACGIRTQQIGDSTMRMSTVCGVKSQPLVVTEHTHLVFGKDSPSQHTVVTNFAVLDDESLPYDMIIGTPILRLLGARMCFIDNVLTVRPHWYVRNDSSVSFDVPIVTCEAADSSALPSSTTTVAATHLTSTDSTYQAPSTDLAFWETAQPTFTCKATMVTMDRHNRSIATPPSTFLGDPDRAGLPTLGNGVDPLPPFSTIEEAAADFGAAASSISKDCSDVHFLLNLFVIMLTALLNVATLCLGLLVPYATSGNDWRRPIASIALICLSAVFDVTGQLALRLGDGDMTTWYKRLIATNQKGFLHASSRVYAAASQDLNTDEEGSFYQCSRKLTCCRSCGVVANAHMGAHREPNSTAIDSDTCAANLGMLGEAHPMHPLAVQAGVDRIGQRKDWVATNHGSRELEPSPAEIPAYSYTGIGCSTKFADGTSATAKPSYCVPSQCCTAE